MRIRDSESLVGNLFYLVLGITVTEALYLLHHNLVVAFSLTLLVAGAKGFSDEFRPNCEVNVSDVLSLSLGGVVAYLAITLI